MPNWIVTVIAGLVVMWAVANGSYWALWVIGGLYVIYVLMLYMRAGVGNHPEE